MTIFQGISAVPGVGEMDKMIACQAYAASMKRCNPGEEIGDTAGY